MTLLYIDGFEDHAAAGNASLIGWGVAPAFTFNTSYGRLGSMGICGGNNSHYLLSSPVNEIIVGIAASVTAIGVGDWDDFIVSIGNVDYDTQLVVSTDLTGAITLALAHAQQPVIARSAPGIVKPGVYGYFEIKATLSNTVGRCIVRHNGSVVIDYTGDTIYAGTSTTWTKVVLAGNADVYMDDLYIADTTGTAPYNDFLGDVRVVNIYPDSNGTYSQGTGSDGNSVDNYALVDENPAPSATDYVDIGVGEKDSYGYQNSSLINSSATIRAVQLTTYAAKTDTGSVSGLPLAILSGTEVTGSAMPLSTTQTFHNHIFTEKPGGGAWTKADLESTEFGISVT